MPMLERALASTEAAQQQARQFQEKETASLAIGLTPSISSYLVVETIAEVRKFVTDLSVELIEEPAEDLVELLLACDINIALVGDMKQKSERIDKWILFAERYVAVLAQSHELADLPEIGLEALCKATILDRANCEVNQKFQDLLSPIHPHIETVDAVETCTFNIWRPRASE